MPHVASIEGATWRVVRAFWLPNGASVRRLIRRAPLTPPKQGRRVQPYWYSRSPKNPALQQVRNSSKSASTTAQRPIWNTFGTVAVRDFSENGCKYQRLCDGNLRGPERLFNGTEESLEAAPGRHGEIMVLLETKKYPGGCTEGRTYLFTAETGYQGGLKLF